MPDYKGEAVTDLEQYSKFINYTYTNHEFVPWPHEVTKIGGRRDEVKNMENSTDSVSKRMGEYYCCILLRLLPLRDCIGHAITV